MCGVAGALQGGCLSLSGATLAVEDNTAKVTLTEAQRVFAYKRSSFASGAVDGGAFSNLRFLWTDAARKKWHKAGESTETLAATVDGTTTLPSSASSYTYVKPNAMSM